MLPRKTSRVGFHSIVMGKWQKKHRSNLLKLGFNLQVCCTSVSWVCEKSCPCSCIHPPNLWPYFWNAFCSLNCSSWGMQVLKRCSSSGQGLFWRAFARQRSLAAHCSSSAMHHGGSLSYLGGVWRGVLPFRYCRAWFGLLKYTYKGMSFQETTSFRGLDSGNQY